ncbi:MAG: tetratricopeptide repeat protein [Bryobacteraceae bacterium]|nr:tetratricopeptide repeat protein [Bryobacteraceae bacterium]
MTAALLFALLLDPGAADYSRGVALIEQGRPDQAVEPLRAAVEAAPHNPQYQKALGVSYAMQKRYTEADPPFAKACALAPALPDACYFHARNLYALDRYEPSLEILRKILATDPRPWRVWLGIAQAEQALGHPQIAEKSFLQAIKLHKGQSPPSDDPRVHYGSFLFREARLDEAATVLQDLCAARPDSARGHLELGRVAMQLNHLDKAEQHLTKSLELAPTQQGAQLLQKVRARK